MTDRQISIRVPVELVERLDALVVALRDDPDFRAIGVSRNGTIRLALVRGMDVLEAPLEAIRNARMEAAQAANERRRG